MDFMASVLCHQAFSGLKEMLRSCCSSFHKEGIVRDGDFEAWTEEGFAVTIHAGDAEEKEVYLLSVIPNFDCGEHFEVSLLLHAIKPGELTYFNRRILTINSYEWTSNILNPHILLLRKISICLEGIFQSTTLY